MDVPVSEAEVCYSDALAQGKVAKAGVERGVGCSSSLPEQMVPMVLTNSFVRKPHAVL